MWKYYGDTEPALYRKNNLKDEDDLENIEHIYDVNIKNNKSKNSNNS